MSSQQIDVPATIGYALLAGVALCGVMHTVHTVVSREHETRKGQLPDLNKIDEDRVDFVIKVAYGLGWPVLFPLRMLFQK